MTCIRIRHVYNKSTTTIWLQASAVVRGCSSLPMIASRLPVVLFLYCVVPVVAPNAPDNPDLPLGSGYFATAPFKVAVALVAANLAILIESGRLVRRGTQWKTEGKTHPIRLITSLLLRISPTTVKRHVKEFKHIVGEDGGIGAHGLKDHLSDPRKRGPPKKIPVQVQAERQALFECLRDKIKHACEVSQLWALTVQFFSGGGGSPIFASPLPNPTKPLHPFKIRKHNTTLLTSIFFVFQFS